MSIFVPAPEPESPLARHRVLAPSAGLKVSPLCLGAMNFGDAWKGFMGVCDKNNTFAILDYFHEQGGNFIDTANNYQKGESEQWIGDWMESRQTRDQMIIATKYTTYWRKDLTRPNEQASSFVGNNAKSLRLSVESSLKNLRTDYIDVLYLHWWDFTTPIEEIMQALNDLVKAGKVLYLAISDTPAWIVSKANQYARDHGLRQFVIYQGRWNAALRDMERDILPMCKAEGMAVAPWGALGGGNFKTDEQRKSTEGRNISGFGPSDGELEVSKILEGIANKRGTAITSIALAYVMNTMPDVYPIVGGRKVEHLKGNIEALKIKLTPEELKEIQTGSKWKAGFPLDLLCPMQPNPLAITPSDNFLTRTAEVIESVSIRQPVFPPGAK